MLGNTVRLTKRVSRISLRNMRTSCQINYPESATKYRVAPVVGDLRDAARFRPQTADHLRTRASRQLSALQIFRVHSLDGREWLEQGGVW